MYKEKLPYSQSALILGIFSIVTACCCWGIIGIILGIIGLNNANKAIRIHNDDPHSFDGINNAQTGRTTAIIGIVVGVVSMLWHIYILTTGEYQVLFEEFNNMSDEY
ncbi:CCC motif membrane protein [Lutimonas halocynthiae]|uniref:CCC motif membrane protein n=1 Tax=Lutimonas halocynthiae TaxID=1446477 RepID=UPI0025B2E46C|nr:CCC motif membrane protein [Lutimonas halocynthiae]MDN3643854.1 CCC motif membrane protein [Lutimonas halocynthiae]